jgi:hypothetical protein
MGGLPKGDGKGEKCEESIVELCRSRIKWGYARDCGMTNVDSFLGNYIDTVVGET